MDDKKDFISVLIEMFLQEDTPREEISKLTDKPIHIPEKLYRYRTGGKRNIKALKKEEMWFSKPSKMNDDFDAMIPYDPDTIKKWVSKHFKVLSEQLLNIQSKQSQEKELTNLISEEAVKTIMDYGRDQLTENIKNAKEQILQQVDTNFPALASIFQDTQKIACFSESITSPLLWGHYAKDSTGFALAYHFPEYIYSDEKDQTDFILLPVKYGEDPYRNEKQKVEEFIYWCYHKALLEQNKIIPAEKKEEARERLTCPDESMGIKILLHKSKEWEPEKEWRLICHWKNPDEQNKEHSSTKSPKPVAIYLGRKITPRNKQKLRAIARKNHIPVFMMKMNYNTYKLEPVLLDENKKR